MTYKAIQGFTRSLHFRLTLWMTLIFFACITAVVCGMFIFFSRTWVRAERDELREELTEYVEAYRANGLQALISLDHTEQAEGDQNFVDVTDAQGRILYVRPAGWKENHPFRHLALRDPSPAVTWSVWKDRSHRRRVESVSEILAEGVSITLGLHTGRRAAVIRRLVRLSTAVSLLCLVIAFMTGFLISKRLLSPLRQLIAAIERSLAEKAPHPPVPHSRRHNDEIEKLALLFNKLLDRLARP